jgi:sodium/bile acid cotransporter 7
LGLKTEEFSKAFQRLWFNFAVQAFNFGVVSAVVFGVSRGLAAANVVSQPLADGMTICSCLPLTINMVLVLTKSSGGDEASAIFNAALGNLCGVFLSPVLILGYIGVSSSVAIWDVFYKLSLRVVLPVAFGQLLQKFSPPVVRFVNEHKVRFKQAQEYCLIYIVYAVFCATFADENRNSNVGDIFIMIAVLIVLLCGLMILAWFTFKFLFPNEPTLRIVALFGATHKTVAMGVPLINSIYEDDPLVGLYTLPLLIWHPLQLLVGSFLTPRLATWVEQEQERLGQTDPNNDATAPAASVDEETPLPDYNDATAPAASVDEETPLPDSKEENSDAIEETDTAAKSS